MHGTLVTTWVAAVLIAAPSETRFFQVAPSYGDADAVDRSLEEDRAVVLIQGLCVHPFSNFNVGRAQWQSWQKPTSGLVTALAKEADVYAVAYSQDVSVEEIAASEELVKGIERLKQLGYSEIVLVGHSAGGLVARQFVEDFPRAGVTKVIQVCAPNGGSSWGELGLGVRKRQEAFLKSLTHAGREKFLAKRRDRRIPEHVEFVCLVGQYEFCVNMNLSVPLWPGRVWTVAAKKDLRGDGIVSSQRQWTADLQEQRIPVVAVPVCHLQVMNSRRAIESVATLVCQKQSRLTIEEVADLQRELLGQEQMLVGNAGAE